MVRTSESSSEASSDGRPLSGVVVLEVAGSWAAPFAGRLLSDFGATVIKVEDPASPDPSRSWSPMQNGLSLGFERINTNKKAIAVNLREPAGQEVLRGLSAKADVLIEAFRPGTMSRWGLSSAELRETNTRLVVLHISGYGQAGPRSSLPGFGTIAEAFAGFAYVNGAADRPPAVAAFGLGDSVAGLTGAFAVTMALFRRQRTGAGEDIDVALYEPLLYVLGDILTRYSVLGEITERNGGFGTQTSPRGVYQCNDGRWVAIAGSGQKIVERLFRTMGRPEFIDDVRFSTNEARSKNDDLLQREVAEWVRQFGCEELLRLLDGNAVAAGPVNDASDIVKDSHMLERKSIVPLLSSGLSGIADALVPGLIAKLASVDEPTRHGAPRHGEHTEEVLTSILGLSPGEIRELESRRTISCGV